MRYFCEDCRHEVPVDEIPSREPYEFWGEVGYDFRITVACGLCGSYNVEEIIEYEKNTI